MAPRTQPAAAPNYGYAEPPRVSSAVQPGYLDSKSHYPPPVTSHYSGSNYSNSAPSTAPYANLQSNESDYAGHYASQPPPPPHNVADQYSSPAPVAGGYNPYDSNNYANQKPSYNGYPSQDADPGAYHHRMAQPGTGYIDQTNGRYSGSAAPRDSVQTHETGSSSYSSEFNRVPYQSQQQGYTYNGTEPMNSVHSNAQYQPLPLPTDSTGDDFSLDVGDLLKRSGSKSSSFASAGSLLEPTHSPTVDRGILTPSLTPTSTRQPAPYGNAPPMNNSNSYSGSGRDFYSPTSGYGTPAIVTTPADMAPGTSRRGRGQEYQRMASMKGPLQMHEDEEDEEDEELEEDRFVNLSLLSHLANRLRDRVPRGTHVKGSIPYPTAFTGKDIVVCSLSKRGNSQ